MSNERFGAGIAIFSSTFVLNRGKMTSYPLKEKIVDPEQVLKRIKPGMSIFLSTGATEPRTMVKRLLNSELRNIEDLELIQIFSFGDAISPKALKTKNFRLKTFFSDWMVRHMLRSYKWPLIFAQPCIC